MSQQSLLFVTGANGQLGRLVVDELLKKIPADRIIAGIRDPDHGRQFAERGVEARICDYTDPSTLDSAFEQGVKRILLISSNEVGNRVEQHRNVIEAAKRAKVDLLAYTSILFGDKSGMKLALEHVETEQALRDSGLPYAILRNGWYNENFTATAKMAIAHHAVIGCAGEGRFSSAARADYAAAAATVLAGGDEFAGNTFELAGDKAYALAEYAAELAHQSGEIVQYKNLPEETFRAALVGVGLSAEMAELLADSQTVAAKGGLFDDSGTLAKLIGHPTVPMADSIAAALKS